MNTYRGTGRAGLSALAAVFAVLLMSAQSWAFELKVKDFYGNYVSGFSYLVEEDTTHDVQLNTFDPYSLGVSIHGTYAPVVANGSSSGATVTIDLPDDKRYFVSVLPLAGYTLSGAQVAEGQSSVTVTVQPHPVPTAQISVLIFHDYRPINGTPDAVVEEGLPGFEILVFDQLGQTLTDAFGNNLGTTYVQNPDGTYQLDGDGAPIVDTVGSGIFSDADGKALIKFLPPGKYGVRAVPRDGQPWVQTSTIEGTPGVDTWIRAGEPPALMEFGTVFYHIFLGFTQAVNNIPPGGTGSISGQAVDVHQPRPPDVTLYEGAPIKNAWVGLTPLEVPGLETIYAAPCNEDGTFTISGLAQGTYQLVFWDLPLDTIIGYRTAIVTNTVTPTGDPVDLQKIAINRWFGFFEGNVFYDEDEDGIMGPGEMGMPNQNINLRFRDGSIYQAQATDAEGAYTFSEVFPWFNWIVAEVDFLRYKATGATIVVDDGGAVSPGLRNNPQLQPENEYQPFRTETGPVLTQGLFLYADQLNTIDWGKVNYPSGENGGISGIVFYGTTRAEEDPVFSAGDPWEPGIPRVQVNLYKDADNDGVIDDLNGDGTVTLADTDNHPFGDFPGPGDLDRNGNGIYNGGDAIQVVTSDSWDDNMPTGCVGPQQYIFGNGQSIPIPTDCSETLQTWNQVRPAVFDGGYAFASYFPGGMDSGSAEVEGLPAGIYIVEAVPPPGYDVQKEEDVNVTLGDRYMPALLPPPCVGESHIVPDVMTIDGVTPAPFAGQDRPLCDRKQVSLSDGQNAAADFSFFTLVPKAGRFVGLVNNDLVNTFNVLSPNIAEKLSPSWLPISFQDFRGKELVRVYSDEYGAYEALIPSSYTVNAPLPSGVSPHMVNICLNHPGPIEDPLHPGRFITDPQYNPVYGQVCYVLDIWPAKTTYPDTPVIPIGAFSGKAGSGTAGNISCDYPDHTPLIYSVSGPMGGPYISGGGQRITITAVGNKTVDNPDFDVFVAGSTVRIVRDYGFGSVPGKVTVGGVPLSDVTWSSDGQTISGVVPRTATTGELLVSRGDNGSITPVGVTLHVGERNVTRVVPGRSIQTVIDHAQPGDLILVPPGIYNENIIMWKPVSLQGWGAGSTVIDASGFAIGPREQPWKDLMNSLIASGKVTLIDGQRDDFLIEQGAGITVIGNTTSFTSSPAARIDGFTVSGALHGGGIFVSGYGRYLNITNNTLRGNQGNLAGGIRAGWPSLVNVTNDGYNSSHNEYLTISRNQISQNGGVDGGGGIALFSGSDNYSVTSNLICGNFTRSRGGGIQHYGLSPGGLIQGNMVIHNEAFYVGAIGGEGGGIFIGGEPLPPLAIPPVVMGPGAGSVTLNANVIRGNLSGRDGGGIDARFFNGQEVALNPGDQNQWHELRILNNFVVNNVSHYLGGGIGLSDVARANIVHNTIAQNDSTATHVDAFAGGAVGLLQVSTPVAAGIVSRAHSSALASASGQTYSDPVIYNNIIWKNRSLYWDVDENGGLGGLLANPTRAYWDLDVFGTAGDLDPRFSILTSTAGYHASNSMADPLLRVPYFNSIQTAATGQEGGNFISIVFTPLKITGDYRLKATSPAKEFSGGSFSFTELAFDIDGQVRPYGPLADAGADEYTSGSDDLSYASMPLQAGFRSTSTAGVSSAAVASKAKTSGSIGLRGVSVQTTLLSITGVIRDRDGRPMEGVEVELTGVVSRTAETDARGRYAFKGLTEGQYTVKPSSEGVTFTRESRSVILRGSDARGQNFRER